MTYKRVQKLVKVSGRGVFLYFDLSDKPKIACDLFVPPSQFDEWLQLHFVRGGNSLFSSLLFIRASLPAPLSSLAVGSEIQDELRKKKQKAIIIVDSIGFIYQVVHT